MYWILSETYPSLHTLFIIQGLHRFTESKRILSKMYLLSQNDHSSNSSKKKSFIDECKVLTLNFNTIMSRQQNDRNKLNVRIKFA